MSELLDWAEKAGIENLKFRLQNAETLAKESASLLTLLLAGMAGTLAYAINSLRTETDSPLAVGSFALAIWLMLLSMLLVLHCIQTTFLPAPTNEPKNLYQKQFELEQLREVELANLQERIVQITARNHRVAAWLDRVRWLAILSPLVFLIAVLA